MEGYSLKYALFLHGLQRELLHMESVYHHLGVSEACPRYLAHVVGHVERYLAHTVPCAFRNLLQYVDYVLRPCAAHDGHYRALPVVRPLVADDGVQLPLRRRGLVYAQPLAHVPGEQHLQ